MAKLSRCFKSLLLFKFIEYYRLLPVRFCWLTIYVWTTSVLNELIKSTIFSNLTSLSLKLLSNSSIADSLNRPLKLKKYKTYPVIFPNELRSNTFFTPY